MYVKTYLILLFVSFNIFASAQDTLTVGEVFDYEIGDVFQHETEACMFGSCYYLCRMYFQKTTIIDKFFNSTNDTLYYKVEKEKFSQCSTPTSLGYSSMSSSLDTLMYFKLDSPVYKLLEQSIDTTPFVNDTFYFSYDFQYFFNGRTNNGSNFYIGDLGSGEGVKHAKGLGFVLKYECSEGLGACNTTKLVYYKKGNEVYGAEKVIVGIKEINSSVKHTSPNPVRASLKIDPNLAFDKVELYNYQGQVVFSDSKENLQGSINMHDFAHGVYLLTFIDDKNQKIHTERIVK